MKTNIFTILIILLLSTSINTFAQKKSKSKNGYEVNLKVDGVKDTIAIFGYYYGSGKYSIDTIHFNSKGEGTLKGDKKFDGGVYFFIFPSRGNSFFELLMGNDQYFSIETDTAGFYRENIKVKGSIDNADFFAFQNETSTINKEASLLKKRLSENKSNKDSVDILREKLILLGTKHRELLKTTSETTQSKTLKVFVDLMRDPEIPEIIIDDNIQNKDSVLRIKKYYYYKNHFFDYVDFSDSTILRTPLFDSKITQYITEVISKVPDTVSKEAIKLIEKSKANKNVFRYVTVYMLKYNEESKLMGMDRVFVDVAKKYYLTGEADWVDSTILSNIKTRVQYLEYNLLGDQAQDLQNLQTNDHKQISLYDIDAKYTVLIFWETNCGHCKKVVPKLYKNYMDMITKGVDVEVLAICTHPEVEPWEKFIEEKQITEWINAYDKYRFTNFKLFYDVNFTPSMYLLDKNKRIIAKRLDADQIKSFIYRLEGVKDLPK